MQIKTKRHVIGILALLLIALIIYQAYPYLLRQVMEWQRSFNLQISASLRQLNQQHTEAGITLIIISFFYGIFHAVGPGHGKFILTSYLSLEQAKLKQAVKISLASAMVQGVVAVLLVSVIVVIFTLSRQYFNLTLQWVERLSFAMMILLGLFWAFQAWKEIKPKKLHIKMIKSLQNGVRNPPLAQPHIHDEHCGCGHQHLPSSTQMNDVATWKTQLFLILSIGIRPCSGAVLVLFLSYTLNIYSWGVFAALMMALGTGLTLTLFALIVVFAREKAVKLKLWYHFKQKFPLASSLKLLMAVVLIGMGILLIHGSFIELTTGTIFRR